mgnify:CR=1 FL=1
MIGVCGGQYSRGFISVVRQSPGLLQFDQWLISNGEVIDRQSILAAVTASFEGMYNSFAHARGRNLMWVTAGHNAVEQTLVVMRQSSIGTAEFSRRRKAMALVVLPYRCAKGVVRKLR